MRAARRPLLAWTGALAAAAAVAQPPAAPPVPPAAFSETVQVEIVNLEVTVSDSQGRPVLGLTREDFELYEDGRRLPISNFASFAEPLPASPGGIATGPALGPPGPPAGAVATPDPERELHIIVYVDNQNIRPLNRNRVFAHLREFLLHGLPAGARVMLVTAERSARIVQPFTQEPALVSSALAAVERTAAQGLASDSERAQILRAMEEADGPERVVLRVRQYVRSLDNDIEFSLGALKGLVEPMAGLPGRKAIVHVSDGISSNPGEDLFWALQEKFSDTSIFHESFASDANRKLAELAAAANSARVTFYTLDASGLRVHAAADVSRGQSAMDRLSPTMDSLWVSNLQGSLRTLAEKTGGIAIVNTNDPGPGLARVADDLRAQYSLGFRAEHGGDGRYHTLAVKVRRDGVVVRHREGYRDKSPAARMGDGTTAVLLYGGGENPLDIDLEATGETRREDGNVQVSLALQIPFSRLVLLPRGEEFQGRLEVFVRVMDAGGALSALGQEAVPLSLPKGLIEAARGDVFTYELPLLMRPGDHAVAVGVRDALAGAAAFTRLHLTAGR